MKRLARDVCAVLALVVGLAGCLATPYQAMSFKGGYEETQLQPELFTVTFHGNAYTDMATVRNYALYRCAELTVARGFDYFEIVRDEKSTERSAIATGTQASEYEKHETVITFRVGKGPKPASHDAYEARFLLNSLHVER